ncbi:ATP-binding protein [Corynebacterium camporealensis]
MELLKMVKRDYFPRLADEFVEQSLRRAGALLIEGPKGCGKTETARHHGNSEVQVDIDPDVSISMGIDPTLVLQGAAPRVLDEWQTQPRLWDIVRHEVDKRGETGQFILTGSTAPSEAAQRHSDAGRFSRLTMHTMTLSESGESTGLASLCRLAEGEAPSVPTSELTITDLAERIVRGGWPGFLDLSLRDVQANLRDYVRTVCELDVATPDGIRRDPSRVMRTIQSLARGVGTEKSSSTIAKDAQLSRDTVIDYRDSLQRIFISQDQPAWSQSLRSRTPLRKAPKRHLADPALVVAALKKKPDDLLKDWEFFGQLFESLVVHELRALTNEPVYHARMSSGDEVDAIATVDDQTILVEVKLGHHPDVVDQAAASLQKFATFVEEPTELLVVTGGGMSYRRPDGVNVIAIGSLGR